MEFAKTIVQQDVRARFAILGLDAESSTAAEFSGPIRSDMAMWIRLPKAAKIDVE